MSKKCVYISYDGTTDTTNFMKVLGDKLKPHSCNHRQINLDLTSRQVTSIESSNLFIAIVTTKYFESKAALDELEIALDAHKTILCLISPRVAEFSPDNLRETDQNTEEIAYYIELMKTLENIKMSSGFVKCLNDPMAMKEICDKANNLLQKSEALIENNKFTPNVPIPLDISDLKMEKFCGKSFWRDKNLLRGVVISQNEIAVIVNEFSNKCYRIFIFRSDFLLQFSFEAKELNLIEPTLITVNKNSIVLIFDNSDGKIKAFRFLNQTVSKKGSLNTELKDYNDMTIDEDTDDIYLLKCINEVNIKVVNGLSKKQNIKTLRLPDALIKSKEFKPRFMRVLKNRIFLLNACSIRIDPESREKEVKFGESFIYVLEKETCEIKLFIDLNNYAMCQPWGLIVDQDLNIYTTLYQVNDKKYLSEDRYLCCFNSGGDLKHSSSLKNKDFKASVCPNDIFISSEVFIVLNVNEIASFENG